MSTDEFAEAWPALRSVYNLPAWGSGLAGDGSDHVFVTNFGPPMVEGGITYGEHHLRITTAVWRLEQDGRVLIASEDDDVAARVTVVDDHRIVDIAVDQLSLSAVFTFNDGLLLKTFSVSTEEWEHWSLFLPEGEVFTAGPGQTWSVLPATVTPED